MPSKDEAYCVLLTDEALAALNKLDKSLRVRVKKKLKSLSTLKPARTLKKHGEAWVLEIGDHRAMHLIDEGAKTRTIFFIGNHKEYEKKYLLMFK